MFDLDQLRCFVVVAEHEHIGRAAEELHMAASPLSRKIRQLERELGIDLFDRQRQRLTLTPSGRDFLHDATELLAHADRLAARAEATSTEAILLTVGVVEGVERSVWFAPAIARFVATDPSVRVALRSSLRSGSQFDAIDRGLLDAGFTYRPESTGRSLRCELVDEQPMLLAVPHDHELAVGPESAPVSADALSAASFVMMPAATSTGGRDELVGALHRCGARPAVRIEAADVGTILRLVAAGAGLALVRAETAIADVPGVVLRRPPVGFDLTVPIYLVTPRSARVATDRFRAAVLADPSR